MSSDLDELYKIIDALPRLDRLENRKNRMNTHAVVTRPEMLTIKQIEPIPDGVLKSKRFTRKVEVITPSGKIKVNKERVRVTHAKVPRRYLRAEVVEEKKKSRIKIRRDPMVTALKILKREIERYNKSLTSQKEIDFDTLQFRPGKFNHKPVWITEDSELLLKMLQRAKHDQERIQIKDTEPLTLYRFMAPFKDEVVYGMFIASPTLFTHIHPFHEYIIDSSLQKDLWYRYYFDIDDFEVVSNNQATVLDIFRTAKRVEADPVKGFYVYIVNGVTPWGLYSMSYLQSDKVCVKHYGDDVIMMKNIEMGKTYWAKKK